MNRTLKKALTGALLAAALASPAFAAISDEIVDMCWKGTPEQIKAAIDAQTIDLAARDNDGNTVLMLIARLNVPTAKLTTVINAGGAVNDRNNAGLTPLMLAARDNPNEEIVEALCLAGADVNADDGHGVTALMYAAEWGTPEVFYALLRHGADLDARDEQQRTALEHAKNSRFDYMIKYVENVYSEKRKNDLMQTILRLVNPDTAPSQNADPADQ